MGSNIKLTLRNKPNKDGLLPIVVRITKDRKSSYIYSGFYINKKDWDSKNNKVKKSYPNSIRLNNLLIQKVAEANKTLIELESKDAIVSSQQIKKEIKNPLDGKCFNDLANEYLLELEKNEKLTQLSSDKSRVQRVIDFSNSNNLFFQEINEPFLRKFMTYLKVSHQNSQRSIVNNLIVIRTLYNRAIKAGIVDRKYYPFGANKIQIKFPETEKIGLSEDEVKLIQNLNQLSTPELHARNAWLFSFYLAGMRVGDILQIKWSDIYDGRLHYRMNKNSKLLSLKLPEKVLPIIESYEKDKTHDDDFIFPEMKKANIDSPEDVLTKTKTANKKFNKYLSKIAKKTDIQKKLTMHIARHTFGNISGDKIPIQTLQKLYRHSSITTTINYQSNFIHKEFDEALDSVIDF